MVGGGDPGLFFLVILLALVSGVSKTIPVREILSEDFPQTFSEFVRDVFAPARPVVLRRGAQTELLQQLSYASHKSSLRDVPLRFVFSKGIAFVPRNPNANGGHMTLREAEVFLENASYPKPNAMVTQGLPASSSHIKAVFSALPRQMVQFIDGRELNLWMSLEGPLCVTGLHFDPYDNLFLAVDGVKSFMVYPFEEADLLHPDQNFLSYSSMLHDLFSLVGESSEEMIQRWEQPDKTRYPGFENATRFEIDLVPGDVLYIPAGFWHAGAHGSRTVGMNLWISELNPFARILHAWLLWTPPDRDDAEIAAAPLPALHSAIQLPNFAWYARNRGPSPDDDDHRDIGEEEEIKRGDDDDDQANIRPGAWRRWQQELGCLAPKVASFSTFQEAVAPYERELECVLNWYGKHWTTLSAVAELQSTANGPTAWQRDQRWRKLLRTNLFPTCVKLNRQRPFSYAKHFEVLFSGCTRQGTCEQVVRAVRTAARNVVSWVQCSQDTSEVQNAEL